MLNTENSSAMKTIAAIWLILWKEEGERPNLPNSVRLNESDLAPIDFISQKNKIKTRWDVTSHVTDDDADQGNSSDNSESKGLKRRSFLKGVASSAALIPLLGVESVNADVTQSSQVVTTPAFLGPGTLLKVLAATGVRAGSLTNTAGNEPVTTARKPFATNDAYADPGYWFFFYESSDLVAAARIFTTRTSGKKVAFSVLGQRTKTGPELISSMGKQVFERSGSRYLCRLLAANYFAQKAEAISTAQHSSPYFVSTQQLAKVKTNTIDQDSKARINAAISKTVSQLGLPVNAVSYL